MGEIEVIGIVVGNPLEWPTLQVGQDKRICSSFNDCVVPLYLSAYSHG